jgi:hypothetical protein
MGLPATAHAQGRTQPESLADIWALEVTRGFAPSVGPRLVARAKKHGINTIVLNRHLSKKQEKRLRLLANRFDLRTFKPRRFACKRKTVEVCAVIARTPAAVDRLARQPYVDVVILRLRRPLLVPRLARERELATAAAPTARLMLLPRLRAKPRFYRASWRRAISAVANAKMVDLGVMPGGGRSSWRAVNLLLGVLAGSPTSPPASRPPPPPLSPPPALPPPPPPPLLPTPPPLPEPLGRVVFTGDFETGNISQWTWGAQCANTGVPSSAPYFRGTISVQSAIVAQGNYGARFDLPAATGYTACETLNKRLIDLGTDDYYGLAVRFPTDWREPSPAGWGLAVAQLNFENIWGSPVMLAAHADHIGLVMQSGLCQSVKTSKPGCAYSSAQGGNIARMVAVPAPMALGAWHELIVHVRWTTDSSGIIEVWHRLKGDSTWNKTVSLTGYPTVQWTDAEGPEGIADATTADMAGAYRGHADYPLTIWSDGFVRTTSFASAAAALP